MHGVDGEMRAMTKAMVVGTDGSVEAGYALAWASREARLRDLPLKIIVAGEQWSDSDEWMNTVLDKAERQVRAAEPGLDVRTELFNGRPIPALTEQSRAAAMIVVGRRGVGGFTGLLLGSVASGISQLAECPVVTVGSPELPVANRIVVGVDGTEDNEYAIGFAFEAASLHQAELRAVHAWTQPTPLGPGDMLPLVYDIDDVQSDESRLLAEALVGWRERFPDVKVDAQTVRGHSVRVLGDRSSDALLLVVGRRASRGRLAAMLGSTSHGVLHHAQCPVVVVPAA